MTGYDPVKELVYFVRSRFRAHAHVLVGILQPALDERFDRGLVEGAETPREMTQADKCIALDPPVIMGAETDTERYGCSRIGCGKSDGEGCQLQFVGIVPLQCSRDIIVRNMVQVLKSHGRVTIQDTCKRVKTML
jgi:hypothetical protein